MEATTSITGPNDTFRVVWAISKSFLFMFFFLLNDVYSIKYCHPPHCRRSTQRRCKGLEAHLEPLGCVFDTLLLIFIIFIYFFYIMNDVVMYYEPHPTPGHDMLPLVVVCLLAYVI